jgi:hypothetical protein
MIMCQSILIKNPKNKQQRSPIRKKERNEKFDYVFIFFVFSI